jgi:hypothetical protein
VNIVDSVFWISLVGLLVLTLWRFARTRNIRLTIFYAVVLLICGVVYRVFFQTGSQISPKSDSAPHWAFIMVLFISMVLGMASNHFYNRFANPTSTRLPFDLGNFAFPFFAAPIIFIPLFGAFLDAGVDLNKLTPPKLMIFLVAFENGFFWREVFASQRRKQRP